MYKRQPVLELLLLLLLPGSPVLLLLPLLLPGSVVVLLLAPLLLPVLVLVPELASPVGLVPSVVVGKPLVVLDVPPVLPPVPLPPLLLLAAVSVSRVPLMNGGSTGSEHAGRTSNARAGSVRRIGQSPVVAAKAGSQASGSEHGSVSRWHLRFRRRGTTGDGW